MRRSPESFAQSIPDEGQESREKKETFVSLEIGAGGSPSYWLYDGNNTRHKNLHVIRTDLWIGSETPEERQRLNNRYGGIGASGSLLRGKKMDERQMDVLKEVTNVKLDYVKCDAGHIPLGDASVNEVYLANVFGAPGFITKQENNKVNMLKEIRRVLKEGGEFIIAETYTPSIALKGVNRDSGRINFGKALREFVDDFTNYGFKIKSVEFPRFSQEAYDRREKSLPIDDFLKKYPTGKKIFGEYFIPSPATPYPDYKFIIVLTK